MSDDEQDESKGPHRLNAGTGLVIGVGVGAALSVATDEPV